MVYVVDNKKMVDSKDIVYMLSKMAKMMQTGLESSIFDETNCTLLARLGRWP